FEALNRQGVVHGIDRFAIAQLVGYQNYGKSVIVAQGTSPVHGEDRKVEYHFNINRGKPYREVEFDRIDLKELNFIENKLKGDLLASLALPVRPVNGSTVTGISIPALPAGEGELLFAGRNTFLDREQGKIFATEDGNARISGIGEISIEPVVMVENVNYETGNIYFDGSVVIKGSIADGFIVEAGGDIQVGKGVGKAVLKAGGNVLLKAGMSGNGEGSIECEGNLFAKYIENSKVVCRGNLFVEEAIMHSQINVWKNCVLNGRRAEVIGGAAIVGGSLWCKKLGNMYDVPTYVAVATRPPLFLEYREVQKKLTTLETDLDAAETRFSQFEKIIEKGHGGDEKILQAKKQTEEQVHAITAEIAELQRKIPSLREKLVAKRDCLLVAEEVIFRGVTIVFGKQEFRVPDNGSRKTILRAGEREILESGYNHWEKPKIEFNDEKQEVKSETPKPQA
ncbi:MAG: FapA family protein, partial [Spirochaetaceae bacterium]|nr:FapA family protein [Spirochaetaceae bacterium]